MNKCLFQRGGDRSLNAVSRDKKSASVRQPLTFTVPLSTQEYKWVPANCWGNLTNYGGVTCDELESRPGGVEILLAASCYGTGISSGSYDQPAPRLHFFFD